MRSIVLLLASFLILNLSAQTFNTGTDLSYLNEMEDCGAIYSEDGEARDPYKIFMDHNTQIVRYRLWHTPGWTDYSTLADVSKSFMRAKEAGFQILLTFHYSDTWADAGQQLRPAAWSGIENTAVLADSMYNYTYKTLLYFQNNGMLPDLVQIGNETNGNILLNEGDPLFPLEWSRNITLFDEGIKAVNQINQNFGTDIKTVIHIAQPENALWWFGEAYINGFTGFDIIGLSYYPGWSEMTCRGAADAVGELRQSYTKEVMVVETGYPWTLAWADDAANSLGIGNLLPCYGFNPSPENQRDFLTEFTWLVKENGGMGVIYWEPAWVSTDCYTQWGQGSHWENATFFDFDYNLHVGIGFMDWDYTIMPPALDSIGTVFKVDMTGIDTTQGVFVTGNFTGEDWQFIKMNHIGENIFEINTKIPGR
nr:glycosyl hydrolase 53 family protein [Bacteroidota bacterium]